MKRIISIILLMCIFALSGCNTESPDTNKSSDNAETIPNESTNIPNQDIPQGSIEEKHFVLESNGYKLNAVYTYIDDGKAHPAVLLIAGSGPSDYDETLGTLKPFILTIVLVFSLTSCKVNWFDQQYDVPWWAIAIPVLVFSAIVLFVAGNHIASKKYVCPKCNKSFYPKWWQAALSIHMNDDRVFKCPHCGRKGFCPLSRE